MLNNLLDLLFPKHQECPLCGRVKGLDMVCKACRSLFEAYRDLPHCHGCGGFLLVLETDMLDKENPPIFCEDCMEKGQCFTAVRSVGPYEGMLKDNLVRFKYTGVQSLAKVFAPFIADIVIKDPVFHPLLRDFRNTLLVPVPLAKEKEQERGFNQSKLLAQELSKILGVGFSDKVLTKVINTPSQAKLVKEERIRNLEGAFKLINSELLEAKHVILIDDIFTTGTTLKACAKELEQYGLKNVYALTVAAGYKPAAKAL